MRTTLLDEMPGGEMSHEQAEPQDVTLGLPALLGIFLAVVLVCAVFFGFGYSTGRTLHVAKTTAASIDGAQPTSGATTRSTDTSEAETSAPVAAPLAASPKTQKPSPSAVLAEAPAATAADRVNAESEPASPAGDLAARRSGASRLVAGAMPAVAAASGQATGTMVQIAAVARPADADALTRALRRNGYSAVVRSEPQDSFLHVQVGPFATRDEARAMRARLQADGYNAFMKP